MIENYTEKALGKSLFSSFLPHWNVPKHTHVFWEFTYSVAGTVKNFVNDIEIECNPLDKVVLIKPGTLKGYKP